MLLHSKASDIAVCPIDNKGDELQYHPPRNIFLSGGFSWGSAYTCEQMDVDLVVEIPKVCPTFLVKFIEF